MDSNLFTFDLISDVRGRDVESARIFSDDAEGQKIHDKVVSLVVEAPVLAQVPDVSISERILDGSRHRSEQGVRFFRSAAHPVGRNEDKTLVSRFVSKSLSERKQARQYPARSSHLIARRSRSFRLRKGR